MGSSIRRGVNINRRAKPIKHFFNREDTTEENLIKEEGLNGESNL